MTGAGAAVVGHGYSGPYVAAVTAGRITDLGITDSNNMGAAMAPAAAATLTSYFNDTGTHPDQYDLIVTGDLGSVGSTLLYDLMDREGYDIREAHTDCGLLIFDRLRQKVNAGGSGCGCSASVLSDALSAERGTERYFIHGDRRVDEHDFVTAGGKHPRCGASGADLQRIRDRRECCQLKPGDAAGSNLFSPLRGQLPRHRGSLQMTVYTTDHSYNPNKVDRSKSSRLPQFWGSCRGA